MLRTPARPSILRTPTRGGGGGRAQARTVFVPPPIGGWNARDPISAMPPEDALILDNLIPDAGYVRLRGGALTFATISAGGDVKSLFSWRGPSSSVLFAATTAGFYNITAGGTIASASLTLTTSGRLSTSQITTSAGSYLYVCDAAGGVAPRYFDGSAWTTTAFTGTDLTTTTLNYVATHMNRLWFVQANSTNAWYAETSAISGTLTKFPIPFRRGGWLELIVSWSRDGGSGPDDYIVFISSNGEVAVYAGTDPSSSTSSALVGAFTIAPVLPVLLGTSQPNFVLRAGGDVAVMTRLGVAGLSQLLPTAVSGTSRVAITDKIARAYQTNELRHGCIEEFPGEGLVFVNGNDTDNDNNSTQFVLNTKTNAWCRFTGLNAFCLHHYYSISEMAGVFIGLTGGVISKYRSENYAPDLVQARLVHAFSDFGTPARKRFLQARPRLHMTASTAPPVGMSVDYVPTLPTSATITDQSGISPTAWLRSSWASQLGAINNWQGVSGIGFAGAPAMNFQIDCAPTGGGGFLYHGCDLSFEAGGVL